MKLIRRYVFRAIFVPAIVTAFLLVGLDGLFKFVDQLQDLKVDYGALQVLQYVVTLAPGQFAEYMPIAILLGTLFGLGMMANSSELVVIRSSGPSLARLCWMALRPALVLLVISMTVGEFVAPHTQQMAESSRTIQRGGSVIMRSSEGYWLRQGNEFIRVNAIKPDGELFGLMRLKFNAHQDLEESQFAARASYQGKSGWTLFDVKGSVMGDDEVTSYQKHQASWDAGITPNDISVVAMDPDDLSLKRQWQYANYLKQQGLEDGEYRLSFWQKVLMPVATIGMVLIAISFIFGSMREVSMGARMTAGIIAGLLFHYGQKFFGTLSLVFYTSSLVAGLLPPLLCVLLGVWLLRRIR